MAAAKPGELGERKGDPTVATLLTWFLPGAGHIYLGRHAFGIAMLVLIEGLYFLGLQLSNGMFLEYLPPEMRTRFAGALTPEAGNLGGLIYHIRTYGYGLPHPRAWPETMHIGTTLTAVSGVLNVMLMSRAHFEARLPRNAQVPKVTPADYAFLGWLVPGLGLLLQGRVLRGVIVFVLLVGLFGLGVWLAEGVNLNRERHFYYWAGQFFLGAPAIIAEFVAGHARVTRDIQYADAGIVMACVAGMLNIMTLLDTYGYAERRPQAADDAQSTSAVEPA